MKTCLRAGWRRGWRRGWRVGWRTRRCAPAPYDDDDAAAAAAAAAAAPASAAAATAAAAVVAAAVAAARGRRRARACERVRETDATATVRVRGQQQSLGLGSEPRGQRRFECGRGGMAAQASVARHPRLCCVGPSSAGLECRVGYSVLDTPGSAALDKPVLRWSLCVTSSSCLFK